jgi:hypothetical protein
MIVVAVFSGLILFSLSVLSEYLAIAITMAMGKPLYLTLARPVRIQNRAAVREPSTAELFPSGTRE